MSKPFAKVVELTQPPNAGEFAVESAGARWGLKYNREEADELADRINRAAEVPPTIVRVSAASRRP
jgi:hypothetical protein